jgi:hypothetical protein
VGLLVSPGTISFTRRTLLHAVKQSVISLSISRHLVSFPCIYWRSLVLVYTQHRTLTMLSSIMQIFLQVSVLQLRNWLPGAAESSVSVTKWLTITSQLKTFDKCIWKKKKHTDHIHVIKHATLYTVTHTHFYQGLTLNNATIKCEKQCKPKLSAIKIWNNSFKWNFIDNRSCLTVHIMHTVSTQQYATYSSAYC